MAMATSPSVLTFWIPAFPLRLAQMDRPELERAPLVGLAASPSGGRPRIQEVCPVAQAQGVRPGMTMAQAMALVPNLVTLEPDPDRLARGTQDVLNVLNPFSPRILVARVGQFHLGMEGLERQYGPPPIQVQRIHQAFHEAFPPALLRHLQIGGAPGRLGATMAAEVARPGHPVLIPESPHEALAQFLAVQPLENLPVDTALVSFLQRLGIRTVGEVARLPVTDLIRQLGAQGRTLYAMARGEVREGIPLLNPPASIRVHLDFPSPTGDRPALERALDHLIRRLMAHPERQGRGLHHLRMGGGLEDQGSWQVDVTLHQPSVRPDRMLLALRTRLNLFPPPRAMESLFLEVLAMGPTLHQTTFLAGASAFPDGIRRAVRDLRLRTGTNPILRVVDLDPHSRIPERRYGLLPVE
jgi:protein ImuB